MKTLLILVSFVMFGCAASVSPEVKKEIQLVFSGPYVASRDAGFKIWHDDSLNGLSRGTILRVVGKPDKEIPGAICYKTAAGPWWFEFSGGKVSAARLISQPPRWRGTDQEAEQWWKETKDLPNWDQW